MLELRSPPCMSIDPSCVGLVVGGNIIEMYGLGETFPEAGVLGTHGWGFVRIGERAVETEVIQESLQASTGCQNPRPGGCSQISPRVYVSYVMIWGIRQ